MLVSWFLQSNADDCLWFVSNNKAMACSATGKWLPETWCLVFGIPTASHLSPCPRVKRSSHYGSTWTYASSVVFFLSCWERRSDLVRELEFSVCHWSCPGTHPPSLTSFPAWAYLLQWVSINPLLWLSCWCSSNAHCYSAFVAASTGGTPAPPAGKPIRTGMPVSLSKPSRWHLQP